MDDYDSVLGDDNDWTLGYPDESDTDTQDLCKLLQKICFWSGFIMFIVGLLFIVATAMYFLISFVIHLPQLIT